MRNMNIFWVVLSVAAIFGCSKQDLPQVPVTVTKEEQKAPIVDETAEMARLLVSKHMKFPSSVEVSNVHLYDYKADEIVFCGEQSSVNGLGNRLPMRPFYLSVKMDKRGDWKMELAVFDDNSLVATMCDTAAFLQGKMGSSRAK